MFSLFPVVLEGLVGLLTALSAPVQGQGGLQPFWIVWQGPKLLPGNFLKIPLTEMLQQLNLRGAQGEEEGPRRHKKHQPLAVPSQALVG